MYLTFTSCAFFLQLYTLWLEEGFNKLIFAPLDLFSLFIFLKMIILGTGMGHIYDQVPTEIDLDRVRTDVIPEVHLPPVSNIFLINYLNLDVSIDFVIFLNSDKHNMIDIHNLLIVIVYLFTFIIIIYYQ